MKNYIFADAIAQSLQADKHSDFCVQRAATPEEARQYAELCEPYAVLLDTEIAVFIRLQRLGNGVGEDIVFHINNDPAHF